ncbi:MAG: methyltransferase type 11 [Alphaproteobacteria bacterium]|nr:methyltransferase type 11 [Alphaproteobacteria bacterium]
MTSVRLPSFIAQAIAERSERLPLANLVTAARHLSRAYRREEDHLPPALDDSARAAYLMVRLPATYAATSAALSELPSVLDAQTIRTCLDVGAGPGTGSLAAHHLLPSLDEIRQIERDRGWTQVAEHLLRAAGVVGSREIADFSSASLSPHDLVISSYALNEVPGPALDATIRRLWSATRHLLVVVEPGTPDGFSIVRRVRELCLELGGFAAAPCTHGAACPMTRDDWCHRAVRVERSALHRKLKEAQLAFEDEKFSYIMMTREAPRRNAEGRIVRRPIRAGGHVHLDLCTADGLSRRTVPRSDRANYKAARDADWGDRWPKPDGAAR